MTPWTGTKYANDSLDRDEQIPNNFSKTLNIRRISKTEIKQAYLSWLEMDRNMNNTRWLLNGKYNCYCNTNLLVDMIGVKSYDL